ncbi:MAG: DUF4129 domain-containing protein [Chitinophagaceae bacterium]|nr:DUF4129 domain-containing protein [Chitinophagaceae bacterium]
MSKRSSFHFLFFLLIACCCNSKLFAQEVTVDTVTAVENMALDTTIASDEYDDDDRLINDTALQRSAWTYPADSIRSMRSQKDFSYMRNLDSSLRVIQKEELEEGRKKKPDQEVNINRAFSIFRIIEILLWALLIGALLFVLYRIFLSDRGLFTSPVRNNQLDVEEEHITDDQYLEKQLQLAIKEKNYRLAVRYLYLQTLNRLAEKQWLILSPDKTNYQYVRELSKPQLKNAFARVTLHYDYAWYGDFEIAEDVFEPVKKEFEQFQQSIKQI